MHADGDHDHTESRWSPIIPRQKSPDEVELHRIEMEIGRVDAEWNLVGNTVNHEWIQCVFEIICTLAVSFFCMVQLIRMTDCESQQLYSGILTFIIGIVIPRPTIKKPDA